MTIMIELMQLPLFNHALIKCYKRWVGSVFVYDSNRGLDLKLIRKFNDIIKNNPVIECFIYAI